MKNERLYVTLSSDGFARKSTVHSLVAGAFLGDNPPNHEVSHQDGDYTNNAARNLEYVTRRENQKRFVMRSGGYSGKRGEQFTCIGGYGRSAAFFSISLSIHAWRCWQCAGRVPPLGGQRKFSRVLSRRKSGAEGPTPMKKRPHGYANSVRHLPPLFHQLRCAQNLRNPRS
jgi:HNH endonuclease